MVSRVKGYIDAGTCGDVTFSTTECGDSASSYFREFTYNNKRVLISNNVSSIFCPLPPVIFPPRSRTTPPNTTPSGPTPTLGALAGSS